MASAPFPSKNVARVTTDGRRYYVILTNPDTDASHISATCKNAEEAWDTVRWLERNGHATRPYVSPAAKVAGFAWGAFGWYVRLLAVVIFIGVIGAGITALWRALGG